MTRPHDESRHKAGPPDPAEPRHAQGTRHRASPQRSVARATRVTTVLGVALVVVLGGLLAVDNRDRIGTVAGDLLQPADAGETTSPGATPTPSPHSQANRPAPRRSRPEPYKVVEAGAPLELAPVFKTVEKELSGTFTVGTYNILGSNHTRNSKEWAPGVVRTRRAVGEIQARGMGVIGMQEVQTDQLGVLVGGLPNYTVWPAQAFGSNGYRLQIAFRDDLFELVDTGSITTAFSGQMRPIPYVKLRDRRTGGEFWFVTVHNSPRGMEVERENATGAEISLLNQLLASGLPVFVSGDMNEPSEFFCRVGSATGMVAANGGDATGGCVLPPRPTGLDWLMGGNGTDFSNYARVHVPGISDHPIVYSDVTLTNVVTRRVRVPQPQQ
jgi:hypothetical protein